MNRMGWGLVVWVCVVAGQSKAWGTGVGAKDVWSAEPLVVVQSDTTYQMAADGTETVVRTAVARVQSESALKELGVLSLRFASKSQHVEWVYARVRHQDGSVTETRVNGALEVNEAVTREAPFYSDLKDSQLPLKDLRVGDQLEWQAKVVRTVAEAPGAFWGAKSFAKDVVVLEETLRLEVPKGVAVTVWSPTQKPVESDADGKHTWVWTSSNLKPTVGAEAEAAKEADKKRVRTAAEELDEREGKLPDVAWTTFPSWAAVGAWYRGLEGERMVPDAEIKAKVAQLTAGKATQVEKVQAVYAYVATQIHYIGVAFGIGRYQPHSAADVLANQYGDCKDKHTLLASMLAALGLKPDAVLIGAEVRFNEAVPSPAAFNHAITRVDLDGKPVWLDTTAEVAPFGMLVATLRDENALVIPDTGPARVEKTPANAPFPQFIHLEATGSLNEEGMSESKFVVTFRGDEEVLVREAYRESSPSAYNDVTQGLVGFMGFGGKVSQVEVSPPDDTTAPMKVSFTYKREKVGDWPNLRTLAQLAPVMLPRPDLKDPPRVGFELGPVRTEVSKAEMKLPAGWTAELPEAQHVQGAYATYDTKYRYDKGVLYAERTVQVLKPRVPLSDWKTYSKWAEEADIGSEPYVQLARAVAPTGVKGKGSKSVIAVTGSDGDAGALVKEASTDLARRDFGAAEAALNKAKELNPKQAWLWSTYGYMSTLRGETETAIADYKREVVLYPNALTVYSYLADAQFEAGEVKDANETLRTWALQDPQNPAAPARLVNFLLWEGKPKDAVATAEAALVHLPADAETDRLKVLLGKAQLAAGLKEKGRETLANLLRESEDAGTLSESAFELANAGLELQLAETGARKAMGKLEIETNGWTLDESYDTLYAQTATLQATWDTMGWVLFREGKLEAARSYVEASWRGRQTTDAGRHLGDIAAARGDKNAALEDYEMARVTIDPYSSIEARATQAAKEKELNSKIDLLQQTGTASTLTDAAEALQKLRTLPLGAAGGLKGAAWYKLLVSEGRVLRAEPTGQQSVTGGADRLKKIDFKTFFPADSKAKLMLVGLLDCRQTVCQFVLHQ
jgi:tetratricopeptide (TPR) repeat protein